MESRNSVVYRSKQKKTKLNSRRKKKSCMIFCHLSPLRPRVSLARSPLGWSSMNKRSRISLMSKLRWRIIFRNSQHKVQPWGWPKTATCQRYKSKFTLKKPKSLSRETIFITLASLVSKLCVSNLVIDAMDFVEQPLHNQSQIIQSTNDKLQPHHLRGYSNATDVKAALVNKEQPAWNESLIIAASPPNESSQNDVSRIIKNTPAKEGGSNSGGGPRSGSSMISQSPAP